MNNSYYLIMGSSVDTRITHFDQLHISAIQAISRHFLLVHYLSVHWQIFRYDGLLI
jgi:hypothetical protein